jgi:hypothetical protein
MITTPGIYSVDVILDDFVEISEVKIYSVDFEVSDYSLIVTLLDQFGFKDTV